MRDSCSRLATSLPIGDNATWTCTPDSFGNASVECTQWVYPSKQLSIMSEVKKRQESAPVLYFVSATYPFDSF